LSSTYHHQLTIKRFQKTFFTSYTQQKVYSKAILTHKLANKTLDLNSRPHQTNLHLKFLATLSTKSDIHLARVSHTIHCRHLVPFTTTEKFVFIRHNFGA